MDERGMAIRKPHIYHAEDYEAKPASLQDSIAAFDAHLAASRDLFTMWVTARLRFSLAEKR
jgi:hypothetical protein